MPSIISEAGEILGFKIPNVETEMPSAVGKAVAVEVIIGLGGGVLVSVAVRVILCLGSGVRNCDGAWVEVPLDVGDPSCIAGAPA